MVCFSLKSSMGGFVALRKVRATESGDEEQFCKMEWQVPEAGGMVSLEQCVEETQRRRPEAPCG